VGLGGGGSDGDGGHSGQAATTKRDGGRLAEASGAGNAKLIEKAATMATARKFIC